MAFPTEPLREQESTYLVQDRNNQEEMIRLDLQDKMLNIGMGGVLPELADHSHLRRVLDVGCGTGNWLIETARTYPNIEKLVGVDISDKMLTFARAQAQAQQMDKRVEFKTMDALRILDFPVHSFDLVNQRAGTSWLRKWDWKKILLEYQRVTRLGGIIRITEYNIGENNSPALTKLYAISMQAFYHAGHFFTPSIDGLTSELVPLMTQHAIENVQTQPHTLVYRAGTPAHQDFYEDMRRVYRLLLPFFQKWTVVPSDYEEIYQQALKEMQQPDFVSTMPFLTVWGTTSRSGESLLMRGRR